ncbi:MAG: hypothetical protein ABIG69_06935 [Bacteroidota bacterium]
MNKVKAVGQLRHRFWGDYSALIYLKFLDKESAQAAKKVLGEPWNITETIDEALFCVVDSKELKKVEDTLEKYGADKSKIASIAKSIDYGEEFNIEVPIEIEEQTTLF